MDGKGKAGLPSFGARQSTVFGLCFLVTLLAYVDRVGFSVAFTKLSAAAGQDQVRAGTHSPVRSPLRGPPGLLRRCDGTQGDMTIRPIIARPYDGREVETSVRGVSYPLPRPSTQPSSRLQQERH